MTNNTSFNSSNIYFKFPFQNKTVSIINIGIKEKKSLLNLKLGIS